MPANAGDELTGPRGAARAAEPTDRPAGPDDQRTG